MILFAIIVIELHSNDLVICNANIDKKPATILGFVRDSWQWKLAALDLRIGKQRRLAALARSGRTASSDNRGLCTALATQGFARA